MAVARDARISNRAGAGGERSRAAVLKTRAKARVRLDSGIGPVRARCSTGNAGLLLPLEVMGTA